LRSQAQDIGRLRGDSARELNHGTEKPLSPLQRLEKPELGVARYLFCLVGESVGDLSWFGEAAG